MLLGRLHMVQNVAASNKEPAALVLTKNFETSLKLALTGGGDHQSFGVPSSNAATEDVGLGFLDDYARQQWEGILHYVVNSASDGMQQVGDGPTSTVKALLETGKLVERRSRHGGVGITQAGFSFLLQAVNTQVWTLLLIWIENAESTGLDSVDVLSFLFMLGSLDLGRAYSTATLTKTQQIMLNQLIDFGLIYVPPKDRTKFYPTRLATTLTSDAAGLRSMSAGFDNANAVSASTGSKGFIIIETNYRLYAYTSSPLQIAVLALFTRLSTRFPNMVSGRVTRDSIRRAIDHGITADQIVSYMSTHAHPQMKNKFSYILPPTVVDQIKLWQYENERMEATPGFLFQDFATQQEYEGTRRYADEIGVLVWHSDAKRKFFVTRHEQLREYIKSRKMK